MDADNKKIIFNFVYSEALRDATSQRAYEGKKLWINEVEEPKVLIQEYIDKIIQAGFKSQEQHDEEFYVLAKNVCEAINRVGDEKNSEHKNEFTFGNAQKLINIAVKHFYVLSYYNESMRENFKYCHCPVDSKMLSTVWKNCKELGVNMENMGNKDSFTKCWSKEKIDSKERYINFQKAVKVLSKDKKVNAVEYDYYMWKSENKDK